jgi:hypothetical protein
MHAVTIAVLWKRTFGQVKGLRFMFVSRKYDEVISRCGVISRSGSFDSGLGGVRSGPVILSGNGFVRERGTAVDGGWGL